MDSELYEYLSQVVKNKDQQVDNPHRLLSLLTEQYLNDGTSFMAHERFTVIESGYAICPGKHGYDGFTQDGTMKIECKTMNIRFCPKTCKRYKIGKYVGMLKPQRKFDGRGIFSDFNASLLERYSTDNVLMLISGFLNGRAVFILQFPFGYKPFIDSITAQLKRKENTAAVNTQLIDLSFTYKDYQHCPDLRLLYLDEQLFDQHQQFFNTKFLGVINGVKRNVD